MTLNKPSYFTALMTCSLIVVASSARSVRADTSNARRDAEVGVDTEILNRMEKIAEAYRRRGPYSYAEPIIQEVFEIRQTLKGTDEGRSDEAEPLYQRAAAILEKTLGENHPEVAESRTRYARLASERQEKNPAIGTKPSLDASPPKDGVGH